MFPPFQTALQLSHVFLRALPPGARAIDATLGNGNDTRFLTQQVGKRVMCGPLTYKQKPLPAAVHGWLNGEYKAR